NAGGELVACGTPDDVARVFESRTGQALAAYRHARAADAKSKRGVTGVGRKSVRKTATAETVRAVDRVADVEAGDGGMRTQSIDIVHAREHNLKNVDVTIPRDKLTVITGVSGSGKSTVAFDILFAEGQRRYLESLNAY